MDTTKKGDELEDKVYELFRDDILNDRFWAKSECCKIYQKKGYYSRDRQKEIIFDIAIEIFLPGENQFSSLVLIECKNYNDKVPVGDVESFLMKAHQVSGGNVKAIVVSNNAFQEGAFNFAESKRMGLLRYYDRNKLEWVLHRSPSSTVSSCYAINNWSEAYTGLHKSEYESRYFDFFGYANNQHTNSLRLFIGALVKQDQEKEYLKSLNSIETIPQNDNCIVQYLDEAEIEDICINLLSDIEYSFGEVPLANICSLLRERNGLVVSESTDLPAGVLGEISFDPPRIKILKSHENEARKRFTLAHELGHLLLGHSKYMSGEKCLELSIDLEKQHDVGIIDVMRMEWQANQFASYLLLPTKNLIQTIRLIAARNDLYDKGFGLLYLDNQQCNQNVYYNLTSFLMERYKVSREATKVRLKKLGVINEPSHIKV